MNIRRTLSRMTLQTLLAKRKAQPRKPGRPKKRQRSTPPKAIERKYEKALQPYLQVMHSLVKKLLIPRLPALEAHTKNIRGDSPLDDIEAIFQAMRDQLDQAWGDQDLAELVDGIGDDVTNFAQKQLQQQLSDLLGTEAQPFLSITPGMDLAQKGFVKDNVRLITSMSDKYFDEVEGMVNDTVRSGSSTDDLAAQMEDRFGVTESRAAFIARDQVSKLNGDIAQAGQTDLGITSYTWRTSLDDRVRPDHADKEGKVYDWDDPPEDTGHPGEDFNCRCTAEPIIPEADDDGV